MGTLAEALHVVWVAEAAPEMVSWTYPDGSAYTSEAWIPQTYVGSGLNRASIEYSETAEGFGQTS
jgi:hypothetical protein